jgi:FKBP-type peptidyl-prolyl cis-trans isomerase
MIKKISRVTLPFLAFSLMVFAVSCDPSSKYEKNEKDQISSYLKENSNLNFVKQPSGLYYLEVVEGTGISPVAGDSAYVNYTGKFLDGKIFDSNVTQGKLYGFIVGQNIIGFDEGVTKMKEGGKSKLLIPSSLGYGTYGTYSIPGYTPLVFDIELVKVVPATTK